MHRVAEASGDNSRAVHSPSIQWLLCSLTKVPFRQHRPSSPCQCTPAVVCCGCAAEQIMPVRNSKLLQAAFELSYLFHTGLGRRTKSQCMAEPLLCAVCQRSAVLAGHEVQAVRQHANIMLLSLTAVP